MKRRLLIVPILHNSADLGSLAPQVKAIYERLAGPAAWNEHRQAVEELWMAIERLLDGRRLIPGRTRLYQDGLPVCGKEVQIVDEVAAMGSRNHLLLQRLMAAGAILEGTENGALLKLEYERVRALLRETTEGTVRGQAQPNDLVTRHRDQFIARRIDSTLGPGETGVLFVGLLHQVEDYLPADLEVEFLLPRPGRRLASA